MKIKTAELERAALDWAVAKCEEADIGFMVAYQQARWHRNGAYQYSSDWSQAGPIIERENISVIRTDDDDYEVQPWAAEKGRQQRDRWHEAASPIYLQFLESLIYGETPLVAAMRCYVVSKLGAEVDIPKELITCPKK